MSEQMASNSKHTEWILETIDHLRRRKARPDLERICHVVRRRYGLSAPETEAKLEKLVDAEIVIKVDYKGSTSYRNAAKWRKSMLGCAVLNSTTISTKILEAVLELSRKHVKEDKSKPTQDKDALDEEFNIDKRVRNFATEVGVSLDSISAWLKEHCDGFENLRSPLTVVLKREIDAGRLKRLLSCNYVITGAQIEEISDNSIKPLKVKKKTENKSAESSSVSQSDSTGAARKEHSNSGSTVSNQKSHSITNQSVPTPQPVACNAPQAARRGRPPKHRSSICPATTAGSTPSAAAAVATTAAATVLVPGSTTQSKLKRILTSDSLGQTGDGPEQKVSKKVETRKGSVACEPVCDLCKLTASNSPKGVSEALLQCKDCATKVHPSCMDYSAFLASRVYRGPWQCIDCKTCCVCQDAGKPDQMLFCDGCDKGYHMNCHNPSVMKKPAGAWECSACRLENLSLQRSEFISRQGHHHSVSHESAPPTPAESPVPANHLNGDTQGSSKPYYLGEDKYPDASSWSVEDVVSYMSSAGFREESKVFLEQEIDGVALLLLKRTDILKGLNLKLGPALKLNRHIQGLQTAGQHGTS